MGCNVGLVLLVLVYIDALYMKKNAHSCGFGAVTRDGNGYPSPAYPPGKYPLNVRVWDKKIPISTTYKSTNLLGYNSSQP
jgi:hypothetical protein